MNTNPLSTPELWVVTGIDPVTWAVPFRVIPKRTAEIWQAMSLTHYQHKIVFEKLGQLERLPNGHWKISLSQLRRIGHCIELASNPEEHFVWERARRKDLTVPARRNRADRDEFLSLMYLRGIGQSEGELEYWLNAFCNAFLWHLINKETPIDLYFCKLHPSPFLDGWHTRLCALTTEWRGHALRKPKILLHPRLLAFDGKTCLRGVELELTRTWFRLMRGVELERVSMLKRKGYAAEYRAWVERQTEQLLRLHDQWNTHRLAASPSIDRRECKGIPIFVSDKRLPKRRNTIKRLGQARGKPKFWKELAEQRKGVRESNKDLRELRSVFQFRNLRQARKFLHRSRAGKTTSGMLVFPKNQGASQIGDMLAPKSGGAECGLE